MGGFGFPIDPDGNFNEQVAKLLSKLRGNLEMLKKDDGRAIAFVYRGSDPEKKKFLELLQCHVMARPEPDKPQKYMIADLVLRDKRSSKMLYEMACSGYVPVGWVDNRYADVLGLVNGDFDGIKRMVQGKTYLPPHELDQAKKDWIIKHDNLEDSKAPLMDKIAEAIADLEETKTMAELHNKIFGSNPDRNIIDGLSLN